MKWPSIGFRLTRTPPKPCARSPESGVGIAHVCLASCLASVRQTVRQKLCLARQAVRQRLCLARQARQARQAPTPTLTLHNRRKSCPLAPPYTPTSSATQATCGYGRPMLLSYATLKYESPARMSKFSLIGLWPCTKIGKSNAEKRRTPLWDSQSCRPVKQKVPAIWLSGRPKGHRAPSQSGSRTRLTDAL